jgi:mRNA deadenylase 3'-5' endonuclease subunit Ccr4
MSKERELLIGAVEWMHELKYLYADTRDAGDWVLLELIADINNIELLLAQTEQEPVAWMYDHHIEVGHDKYTEFNVVETCARNLESENCINVRPLYLTPQKREPLSDERLRDLSNSIHAHPDFDNVSVWQVFYIARAIEKAHGIGGKE